MLPEKLSTDLTSLNDGRGPARDGRRDGGRRPTAPVTRSDDLPRDGPQSREARLQRVAAWLDGDGAARRPRWRRCAGLDEQLRMQDRAAQALKRERARARRARARDDRGAAGLRRRRRSPTCAPDEKNRAKELIEDFMIAANGVDRALPRRQGLRRRCAACCARPSAGTASSQLAAELGETPAPRSPTPRALDAFLRERRAADPARFPDLSLAVVKLLGSGEYAVDGPARSRPGHFGARRRGLHALDGAEPALSRSRHAAPAQGGARRASPRPTASEELGALARALHRQQEDNAAKVERQVASPRRRCSCRRASARRSTASSPARRPRERGCASRIRRWRAASCAAPTASTWATA